MDADGPGDGDVDQDLDPLGGAIPFLSESRTVQPITMFRRRYPFRTIMSQKRIELGVG
jgi:hypothetical protein